MDEQVLRRVLFSRVPLKGSYRYRDLFQLLPVPADAPRPPTIMGDYPLQVELKYDPGVSQERTTDLWHRDLWERKREKEMDSVSTASAEQQEMHKLFTSQRRPEAILKELTDVLSVLTNHTFFQYKGDQSWVIPVPYDSQESVWAQTMYKTPTISSSREEDFSIVEVSPIRVMPLGSYFSKYRDEITAGTDSEIQMTDQMDHLLDKYFSLEPVRKQAFYVACHLLVQALELRHQAPSLSLVGAVSAIETLVSVGIETTSCPTCGQSTSTEICEVCHLPQFLVSKKFKEFIKEYVGSSSSISNFATRLYGFRSDVTHVGRLLRVELGDTGFYSGGKDEQADFSRKALWVPRFAIVKWLLSQEPFDGADNSAAASDAAKVATRTDSNK